MRRPWRCYRCCIEAAGERGWPRPEWVNYRDPDQQGAACNVCGEQADPDVETRVAARMLREHVSVPAVGAAPRSPRERPMLSLNATARRLGRSKSTLRALADAGEIRTVPWPGKKAKYAFPMEEIERIEREGLPRRQPVPVAPKKRRNTSAAQRGEREAAVQRILAVEET